jgi:hypothetical protein
MSVAFSAPVFSRLGQAATSLLLVLVSLLSLSACRSDQRASPEEKKADELYRKYVDGNADVARQALLDEIALWESSTVVVPRRKSAALFMTTARLFVLETRLGKSAAAELALVKARYWNLKRYELGGPLTESDVVEYQSLTPDRIVEMIDQADKSMTQGRGPKYTRTE